MGNRAGHLNSPVLVARDDIGLPSRNWEVCLQSLLVGHVGEHHQQQVEQYQADLRWTEEVN